MSSLKSAKPNPERREAVPQELVEEQLRGIYQHMMSNLGAATIFAAVLAWAMTGAIQTETALGWAVVKVMVVVPRVAIVFCLGRSIFWSSPHLLPLTLALIGLDGIAWGIGAVLFVRVGGADGGFAAASLSFVACLATFGYQNSFKATIAYAGPILVGVLLGFAISDEPHKWISTAAVALALMLMLKTSGVSERRFFENHRLRRLAQSLSDERAEALQAIQGQSDMKSRLMANVSHEIRSPLHSILGLAHQIEANADPTTTRTAATLIVRSGDHLLHLVNELLDQSKLESGTMRVSTSPMSLREVFDELAAVFATRANSVGVEFDAQWQLHGPQRIMGDAERIRQVIDNLLGNAIKFTPAGGAVRLVATPSANSGFRISVIDSGPGIAPANLKKIFQPFEQASDDPKTHRAGAGLGLSIAHDLAKVMGGEVTVTSSLGHGSTFSFSLVASPAPIPTPGSDAIPTCEPVLDLKAAPHAVSGLVLIADDDPVCALVSRLTLEQSGFSVEVLHCGEAAVARMESGEPRPSLVLMDCDMPGMGGLAATAAIRAQENARGRNPVKIIALTGRSTAKDRDACYKAGMNLVLTKPFAMRELSRAAARDFEADEFESEAVQ